MNRRTKLAIQILLLCAKLSWRWQNDDISRQIDELSKKVKELGDE